MGKISGILIYTPPLFRKERNESPEKPFSGKFKLRISPELHREAYVAAKQSGQSLNSWVCDVLRQAL
ncbi:MAG: type II toxin-antitoxin system HicB family antitoxin [Tatlockia sp.]|nr:type II toxin-antitoxin system HicB family antitoxin [Tatlockia sp.]